MISCGAQVGYPDRASVMIVAIYELIRTQRNDFGHPREAPPRPNRDDVNAHLQIFPTYYATAEALRQFLATNHISSGRDSLSGTTWHEGLVCYFAKTTEGIAATLAGQGRAWRR